MRQMATWAATLESPWTPLCALTMALALLTVRPTVSATGGKLGAFVMSTDLEGMLAVYSKVCRKNKGKGVRAVPEAVMPYAPW